MIPAAPTESRQVTIVYLSVLAVIIGVVTGLGAIVLRVLISIVHNLAFLGTFSLSYDANQPTPAAPFGAWVILSPVIGGLIVLFIVRRWAPEAKGHGVPEVMDAIYYKGGKIRPAVVVIKSLASAISIGSGASVGREGPIIQIGSGIGSILGQMFHLRSWQVITLVAAGAGAGIAATFNTPLGAVMFAIELMLPEFSARTLLPVVLATGTATYVGRFAFGLEPAFLVGAYERPDLFVPLSADMLPLYLAFGALAGVAATVFVKGLYRMEDAFDDWKINPYLKNIAAMGFLGVLMYVLFQTTGMYHTASVGYDTIQAILTGQISGAWFLLMLFFLKMLATSVSLSGGASGGVFSPSLFLGATLGGAFGAMLDFFFPYLGFSPIVFGLIGMATIVGGSTGATMTSIMMIFEMTGDYSITVAAIIAVVCAVGVRTYLSPNDIYTTKLVRRGHHIPRDRRSHMFPIRLARDVMEPVVATLDRAQVECPTEVARQPSGQRAHALVTESNRIVGIVEVDPAHPTRAIGVMIEGPFALSLPTGFVQQMMERMANHGQHAVLVLSDKKKPRPENVLGVVTRTALADSVIADFRR